MEQFFADIVARGTAAPFEACANSKGPTSTIARPNEDPHPFMWQARADEISGELSRLSEEIPGPGHQACLASFHFATPAIGYLAGQICEAQFNRRHDPFYPIIDWNSRK